MLESCVDVIEVFGAQLTDNSLRPALTGAASWRGKSKPMFIMLIPLQMLIVLVVAVRVRCSVTTTTSTANTTDNSNFTTSSPPPAPTTTTTTTVEQEWKPLSIVAGEVRPVETTTTTPISYNFTTIDPRFDTQLAQFPAARDELPEVTTKPMSQVDDDDQQDVTTVRLKKKRKKKQKVKVDDEESEEIDECCRRKLKSQKFEHEKMEEDEEQDEDDDDGDEDSDFDDHNTAPIMLVLRSNSRSSSSKTLRKRIKKNLSSQSSSTSSISYGRHKKPKKKARKSKKSKSKNRNKNKVVELSKPVMLIAETVQSEQGDDGSGDGHKDKHQLKSFNLTGEQLEKLAEYFARKNQPTSSSSTSSVKTRDLSSTSAAQYDLEPEVEYVQVSKGQLASEMIPTPPPMPAMPVMANIYWRKVIYPPEPALIQQKVQPLVAEVSPPKSTSVSVTPPSPSPPDPYRPLINTRQPVVASSPSSSSANEPKTANTKSVKKYTIYYIEKNGGKSKADQDNEEEDGEADEDEEDTEGSDANSSTLSRPATIDKILKQIIEQNNDNKSGKTKYHIHKVTDSKVVFPAQFTRSTTASGRAKRIRLVPMTDEPRRHHHRYIYG